MAYVGRSCSNTFYYVYVVARHNKEYFLKVHNSITEIGLRWGMALFITSEVMFFVAFFWAFFDASLLPKTFLAEYKESFHRHSWNRSLASKGIETFDPLDIPYLNTLILLLSGTTCTWAHHELREVIIKRLLKVYITQFFWFHIFTFTNI